MRSLLVALRAFAAGCALYGVLIGGMASAAVVNATIAQNLILSPEAPGTDLGTCLIGSGSCPNPDFPGGASSYDQFSANFTVAFLAGAAGGNVFDVVIDVNQTNAASPQTLDAFVMEVDNGSGGVAWQQLFAFSTQTSVPAFANGTGKADYRLQTFSLAGLDASWLVRFGVNMSSVNDGFEHFSLVTASPVPIPAALPLFGTGLLAFGLFRRLRRRGASEATA